MGHGPAGVDAVADVWDTVPWCYRQTHAFLHGANPK